MKAIRLAVIGAGTFGRHHVRAIRQLREADLVAIVDIDLDKAQQLANEYESRAFRTAEEGSSQIDAAILATPTVTHEEIATKLLQAGVDVLIEKPIADSSAAGERLAYLAEQRGRILQVGHLERFNPAIVAVEQVLTTPLFFEVHRLSTFTPRSLDIDVVLDLMIHDLDIVLSFTQEMPQEIRAAGISVLSPRVDIANVRLLFASGCVANLTASRISTEKIRKLRLFQPGEYISLDYQRQDAIRVAICKNEPNPAQGEFVWQNAPVSEFVPQFDFDHLPVKHGEPLQLELAAFFTAVRDRSHPRVDGSQAANTLRVAEAIIAKINEHAHLVAETLHRSR
ncbi:MAG: Gfo/Idh/MocA family oxidoreductase [Bryobacteraceae bacterium]